jgi:hypothetical protein
MRIAKYRSLWGIDRGLDLQGWAIAAVQSKSLGYGNNVTLPYLPRDCIDGFTDGLEIDIHGLDPKKDLPKVKEICCMNRLDICVMYVLQRSCHTFLAFHVSDHTSSMFRIFTSWPQYVGPPPTQWNIEQHIARYKQQLHYAKSLEPALVNAHSGAWV